MNQDQSGSGARTAVPSPMQKTPLRLAESRPRVACLDGLRGVSAFYVVLFHVVADGKEVLSVDNWPLNLLRFGHEAVVVFIVLSGFVLSLPVARSAGLTLPGGLGGFVKRRARRILPGYYAALFLYPLYFLVKEILKQVSGRGAD